MKQRRVIITGGSSGIGRTAAARFAAAGDSIWLFDLAPPSNEAAIAGWSSVDVRSQESVAHGFSEAIASLGGLDVLVNCAGVATTMRLEDTDLETWNRLVDVNLTGVYLTCREAIAPLKASGSGSIVNLASASGLTPSFAGAAYSASKAGVVMLSKALARELAPDVRVNAVCPGAVRTPMFEAMAGGDEEAATAVGIGYALGRIAEPDEIVDAIEFLAGPSASFVTGVALAIDGGRSFH